jgi:death-on-curing protein
MKAPRFLSIAQVADLHRLSLELHGGHDGLRDAAAFEAAVYQPQNTWFYGGGDIYDVAAAYAYHLAESQSCIDGNKRTGMAAALVFLRLNGTVVPESTDLLHQAMIAIAARRLDKPGLAKLLRELTGRP